MHKQLTLIETENAGWKATDTDREAANRGLAASRKALQEGRKRLADLLNAAEISKTTRGLLAKDSAGPVAYSAIPLLP